MNLRNFPRSFKFSINFCSLLVFSLVFLYTFIGILKTRYQRFLDIDESGYAYMAFNNWNAFHQGGVIGFINSILIQPLHAPIQPVLSALTFSLAGPKTLALFIIPCISFSLTLLICFKISLKYIDLNRSVFASLLLLSIPILVKFSHTYIFATITTLFILLCYYLIIFKYNNSYKFFILVGLFLAFIPLTRTVSIIFLPSLILLLIFQNIRKKNFISIKNTFTNISLCILSLILVMYPWLHYNFEAVASYFKVFGYGKFSVDYGAKKSILSLKTWIHDFSQLFKFDISLILAITFLISIMYAIQKVFNLNKQKSLIYLKENFGFIFMQIFLLYFIPLAILNSTNNQGYGFRLIYFLAAYLLIVIFVAKFLPRSILPFAWVFLVISLILNFVPKELSQSINIPSQINLNNQIVISVYNKREFIDEYLLSGLTPNFDKLKSSSDWFLNSKEGFESFNNGHVKLLRYLERKNLDDQNLLLTFRHRLFNPNTLNLIRAKEGKSLIPISFLPVHSKFNTNNSELVNFGLTNYCLIAVSKGRINEILPEINQNFVINLLSKNNFTFLLQIKLPDNRSVSVFKKSRC